MPSLGLGIQVFVPPPIGTKHAVSAMIHPSPFDRESIEKMLRAD
jgi:hypothetical protein